MSRSGLAILLAGALVGGACASPAGQQPSAQGAALDTTEMDAALLPIDDLTAMGAEADDLDRLLIVDPADDVFVVDDTDPADLAVPDFDQELDLGE